MTKGAMVTTGRFGALARILACTVVFVAVLGSARSPTETRAADVATSEIVKGIENSGLLWCGYKCLNCAYLIFWDGKHIKYDPAWQGQLAENYGWTECIEEPVLCPADNDECESPASSDDVAELWRAAAANDQDALASLVSRGVVEFNTSRRALQALGCGETVIAHVPLTSTQFRFLTAATTSY